MSVLSHVLIVASYGLVAAVLALVLPQSVPMLDPLSAKLAGLALFLLAAVVHEASARRRNARELIVELHEQRQHQVGEFDRLRQANDDLASDLDAAKSALVQLRAGLEEAREAGGQAVVAEMKVLQSQLAQLANAPQPASPAGRAGPAHSLPVPTGTARAAPGQPINVAAPRERPALPPVASGPFSPEEVLSITRRGLEENRVDLYLQPVVSLPQRKTRFYEAFSRIRMSDGSMLVPQQYIDVVAEAGLLPVIDNLLLLRCVQLVRRVRQRNMNVGFFVNLTLHTLSDQDFVPQFIDFLEKNRAVADDLIFELQYHDVSQYWHQIAPSLERLRHLGFRFSLDHVADPMADFASFAERGFRFVKIPAAHILEPVNDVRIDPQDLKALFQRHQIDLIITNVETEAEVVELLDFNVDFGQGFLFGEPRPSRE